MGRIIPVQHLGRNIWYVSTRITFSSHINLEVRNVEDRLKVEEEIGEVSSDILLAGSCDVSDSKSCPNRLLNPKNVGEVHPGIRVEGWLVLPPTPDESSILLEETF